MANFFDQFDAQAPVEGAGNFFDQFDEGKPAKEVGGFKASAKQIIGSTIKGAGQAAADFIPGIDQDNAVKRYGQEVIDANPTAVRSLEDIPESPWTAVKEATGNAAGSMAGMLATRALGQGITAAAPFTGPLAPAVALAGQAVAWLGPAAIAALPSFGGIRDKQILNDPANQDDAKSKAIAALGAGVVGAIETRFGPQNWALAAMTKEGRAKLAEKFVASTLTGSIAKGVVTGAAVEGAEELVQNPIEQLASGDDPRTPKNLKETAFGGAMGFLGGGVLGGAFGVAGRQGAAEESKTAKAIQTIAAAPDVDTAIAAASKAAAEPAAPIAGLAEAGGVWPLKLEPRGLIESAQGESAIFESVKEGERMAAVDDPQRRADVLRAVQETVARQQRDAVVNREREAIGTEHEARAAAAVRRSEMANQRFSDQEAQAAEKARAEAIAPLAQADAENRAQAIAQQILDHDARGLTTATAQAYRAGLVRRIEELGFEAPEVAVPEQPLAPKTVAGLAVEAHSDAQLQALAADPQTPATTRHAAAAALQTRQNPEDRGDTRVVDAPTLAPSGPSEAGAAPGRGVALPDTTPKPQIGGERPTEGSERPDLGRTGQQEQRPAEASKAPKAEPAAMPQVDILTERLKAKHEELAALGEGHWRAIKLRKDIERIEFGIEALKEIEKSNAERPARIAALESRLAELPSQKRERIAAEKAAEPIKVFGKTLDKLTAKELNAAVKAGSDRVRAAATAELGRRKVEAPVGEIEIPRGDGRLTFDPITGGSQKDGAFTIKPARYAKGKVIVQTPSTDGFKTRAARLADHIARGQYTGREHGYVMSPAQTERFHKLFSEGADANVISDELIMPKARAEAEPVRQEPETLTQAEQKGAEVNQSPEAKEGKITARPTGFPAGGWYAVDENGDTMRFGKPDGEMPRRFDDPDKAVVAGERWRAKNPLTAASIPQSEGQADTAAPANPMAAAATALRAAAEAIERSVRPESQAQSDLAPKELGNSSATDDLPTNTVQQNRSETTTAQQKSISAEETEQKEKKPSLRERERAEKETEEKRKQAERDEREAVTERQKKELGLFSRQSENIERYVFQTVKDKNGMPVFGNAEVVLGRANPEKVIARGEGVNTYQWKIFDRTKPGEHGDKYLRVGELHADLTPEGTFEALRNITIYKRFRQKGNGYGENVVASMLATNTGRAAPMRVINILHDTGSKEFDAIHFWKKMGVRLYNLSNDPNVEIDGDVSLSAYLRARGERSRVSVDESIQERGEGTQAQDASGGSESARRADENSADAGTASGTGRAGILGRSDAETGSLEGRQALIQSAVEQITAKWGNAPEVVVVDSMQSPEVPAEVRNADAKQQSQGATGTPEGFFHQGKVYLVAEGIANPERVATVLLHESLGHFGLRNTFGERLNPILDDVARAMPGRVKEKAEQYGLDFKDVGQRRQAAEEVLANLAQTMPRAGLVKRAIAAIRQFLRDVGFDIQLSDNDIIVQMILPARDFVERGRWQWQDGTAFARRISPTGYKTIRDFVVPETPEYEDNTTGDLAYVPDGAVKRGVEALPIRLPVGQEISPHVGQGIAHMKANADRQSDRAPTAETGDQAEDLARDLLKVLRGGVHVHTDSRGIVIRSPSEKRAVVLKRVSGGGEPYYSVITARPAETNVWGQPAWSGRLTFPDVSRGGSEPPNQSVGERPSATNPERAGVQTEKFQFNKPSPIVQYKGRRGPEGDGGAFSRSTAEQAMGAVQGGRETTGNRASWDAPELGKLDTFIRVLQDKHIDSKRVVAAIKNATGALRDATDVYLQEELFHGRSAKAVAEFLDMELRPLFAEMVARKVEMPELEEYLHARHAEERNQQIAKINPEMPDGGSGMDTANARAYLEALDPAKKRAYEALAKRVDAINAKTRQDTIAYGLESPDTIRAWEAAYQNYVPLHREDMEGGPGIGQGYSVRGPASKRATGSKRAVVDILANVAMQRERVVVRGEKNRVSNALIGLATENPNPDFWKVDKPPILKVVNDRTGLVEERVDPMFKSRENVIVARMPGADGNVVEHAVIFNERDERAMRMVTALKNLDAQDLGEVLGLSAKVTRYFSSINTQYNPVFGVVNLIRDTQGALFNLSTTDIRGKQADVMKHTISALRGIYIDARAARSGVQPTSAWSELWEEFQREGGQTGYRDMFRTSKDRAEAIEREIKRVSEGKAKQFGRAVFDWLSDYNNAMENAVRLAAYKVGKENGMTNQRAASMAKNLTVNFNRKGQIGVQTGALYAFFNASVQGTARMLETLNGPSGRKIIAGGFMLGSMQALLLAAAGFDDDEPPAFVRERSLILPIGDKKYLTLPMPLGLHILPNLGRIPTEFVLGGFKHPQKKIASLVNVFVEAFNPIGNAGLSLQTIAPTAIDPIAALAENKDWTGKPIAREDFNKLAPTPGHTRAKDTASAFSKAVSQALNWVSGGTNYKPGIFSPTPDQLDYLIGQVAGGLGREAMKTEQTVTSAITGEEMPTYKIPLIGRFYGSSEGQAQQGSAFYSNLKEINEHEAEIKGRRKAGEPIGDYLIANPEARLVRYANHVERQVSLLRRQKRELTARGADREQIKTIDARITQLMRVFNERVRSVTEKEAA